MKKLLSVTAVLIAAALFFAGCNNAANTPEDAPEEKLPGTWVSSLTYYNPATQGNWTYNKNKVSYKCTNAASLGIEKDYSSTFTCGVSATQLYGVRAKIKQDAFTKAEPGLILFLKTSENSNGGSTFDQYYSLTFYKGSYTLYEKEIGKQRVCLSTHKYEDGNEYSNTYNDAIKDEGNENEVLFYTDGDKMVLKVNGTLIKTFDKKLDDGKTTACMYIPGGLSGAINANWEFLEFQTAK